MLLITYLDLFYFNCTVCYYDAISVYMGFLDKLFAFREIHYFLALFHKFSTPLPRPTLFAIFAFFYFDIII